MKNLSPGARAFFDRARDKDLPDSAQRERIRGALFKQLGLPALPVSAVLGKLNGTAKAVGAKAIAKAAGGAGVTETAVTIAGFTKLIAIAGIAGSVALGTSLQIAHHRSDRVSRSADRATRVTTVVATTSRPEAPSAMDPSLATPVSTPVPPVVELESVPESARATRAAHGRRPTPSERPLAATPVSSERAPDASATPVVTRAAPAETATGPIVIIGDTFETELTLMSAAHDALRSAQPARALAMLDQHARLYPHGALAEEGLAARVLALCALGRVQEAQDVAGRLRTMAPRSPSLARLRSSCAPDDPANSR